jgi:hypothetical protein
LPLKAALTSNGVFDDTFRRDLTSNIQCLHLAVESNGEITLHRGLKLIEGSTEAIRPGSQRVVRNNGNTKFERTMGERLTMKSADPGPRTPDHWARGRTAERGCPRRETSLCRATSSQYTTPAAVKDSRRLKLAQLLGQLGIFLTRLAQRATAWNGRRPAPVGAAEHRQRIGPRTARASSST